MKEKLPKLVVEQDPNAPVPAKIIAKAIVDISKAMQDMNSSGLKRKAIVILVARSAGVSQGDVERVLWSLESLRKDYTNL